MYPANHALAIVLITLILSITTSYGQTNNAQGGIIQSGQGNQGTVINNPPSPPSITYTVCSGEYEGRCQGHDVYLYCYTDIRAWANARCGSALVQRANTYGGN
jgi:hypothetical protein